MFKKMNTKLVMLTAMVLGSASAMAQDPVVLPETGVDLAGTITAAITFIGSIVGVAVAGYAVFVAIRAGLKWIRTALA